MSALRVVIVSGLSGAGKSTALRAFEDVGYFCVDNLPTFLLAELLNNMAGRAESPRRLAVGMDVRDPSFPSSFLTLLPPLRADYDLELLFLEADDAALLRRFSEMRRPHPLAGTGTVREGIARERQGLADLLRRADLRIDTSTLSPHGLRGQIRERFGEKNGKDVSGGLRVILLSFGFKHGVPIEADLLFDVRFLANPHYVPTLREYTGLEREVAAFVLDNDEARRFLDLLQEMLAFLIPLYRREDKAVLTIGIGCTGGRHRSVAVVQALQERLAAAGVSPLVVVHRELAVEAEQAS